MPTGRSVSDREERSPDRFKTCLCVPKDPKVLKDLKVLKDSNPDSHPLSKLKRSGERSSRSAQAHQHLPVSPAKLPVLTEAEFGLVGDVPEYDFGLVGVVPEGRNFS